MNKLKQTDTKYANGTYATHLINQKRFKACNKVGSDLYEVESHKKKHKFDLPLHLGVFTYQYAKLRMLQWQYDFMQKFLPRNTYENAEMDTDSCYFGISKPTLDECVPLELKRAFYTEISDWFPAESCPKHRNAFVDTKTTGSEWVPHNECCRKFQAYDKRTPGKFKFEFVGDGIVALCSKTYVCFGAETKLSCKGLQKNEI